MARQEIEVRFMTDFTRRDTQTPYAKLPQTRLFKYDKLRVSENHRILMWNCNSVRVKQKTKKSSTLVI